MNKLNLITLFILFMLIGCVNNENLKKDETNISKLPILSREELININFNSLIKKLYAKPVEKYSTKYQISGNILSYSINKILDYLNQYCRLRGYHIDQEKLEYYDEKVNVCYKLDFNKSVILPPEKRFFGYQLVRYSDGPVIYIYTPDYFRFKMMSRNEKMIALGNFLIKHGAKKIRNHIYDISQIVGYKDFMCYFPSDFDCGTDVYYMIKRFFFPTYGASIAGERLSTLYKKYNKKVNLFKLNKITKILTYGEYKQYENAFPIVFVGDFANDSDIIATGVNDGDKSILYLETDYNSFKVRELIGIIKFNVKHIKNIDGTDKYIITIKK